MSVQPKRWPAASGILFDAVGLWAGGATLLWLAGADVGLIRPGPSAVAMSPMSALGFLATAPALHFGQSPRARDRRLVAVLGGIVLLLLATTIIGPYATGLADDRMSLSATLLFVLILGCLWSWRGAPIPVFPVALFGMSASLGMLASYGLDAGQVASSGWRVGMSVQSAALFLATFLGIALAPDKVRHPAALPRPEQDPRA